MMIMMMMILFLVVGLRQTFHSLSLSLSLARTRAHERALSLCNQWSLRVLGENPTPNKSVLLLLLLFSPEKKLLRENIPAKSLCPRMDECISKCYQNASVYHCIFPENDGRWAQMPKRGFLFRSCWVRAFGHESTSPNSISSCFALTLTSTRLQQMRRLYRCEVDVYEGDLVDRDPLQCA